MSRFCEGAGSCYDSATAASTAKANQMAPFDNSNLPIYIAPRAARPEVLVDQYRIMLADPTDGSLVGNDGGVAPDVAVPTRATH